MIGASNLKAHILANTTEAEIFAFYLNTDVTEIYKCINDRYYRIHNVHRSEEHASFGLQYVSVGSKIKLYGKDFAVPTYSGDCFHYAACALNCNSNNPKEFIYVCKHIIKNVIGDNVNKPALPEPNIVKAKPTILNIEVAVRDYDEIDLEYWGQFGIRLETLVKENIFPISGFTIDGVYQNYIYEKDNPIYAYFLGVENNTPIWEIYAPYEVKWKKFRTNFPGDVKELYTVLKRKFLILTKSKKDKALITQMLSDLHITNTDVKYASESARLRKTTRNIFSMNYKFIFVMYDLDSPGMQSMGYYNKEYGYLLMPFTTKYLAETLDNHPKDISDFSKTFGYLGTLELFKTLFNIYTNEKN
ncbi:hypothetical protein DSECCO2_120580 [anaerobic digester metagenome]